MLTKTSILSTVGLLALLLLGLPNGTAAAHPGGLSDDGTHACRTSCAQWGLEDNQVHAHDAQGNAIVPGDPVVLPPPVRDRKARGRLGKVRGRPGQIVARGWAYDPDRNGSVRLTMIIDGKKARTGLASKPSPSLAKRLGDAHAARGFAMAFAATPGQHRVCIRAESLKAPTATARVGAKLLGCKTVTVRA